MELNREQIIKALELLMAESNLCTNQKYIEGCGLFCSAHRLVVSDLAKSNHNECNKNCEHYSPPHIYCVLKDVLALIKELTEEYESMAKSVNEASDLIRKLIAEKEELTDEKNRYKRYYFNHCFDELIVNKEADIKADTVRKMQERLTTFFANDDMLKYNEVDADYINECIDQIAKEMLEGVTENG